MRDLPRDPGIFDLLDWHQDEIGLRSEAFRDAVAAEIENLPEEIREVINGVFFERVSMRHLAQRLRVTRFEIDKRLKEGLALMATPLESWLP